MVGSKTCSAWYRLRLDLYSEQELRCRLAGSREPHLCASQPREQATYPTDTATSKGKQTAHNSAVLLCRLSGISRADQVVLHPKTKLGGFSF